MAFVYEQFDEATGLDIKKKVSPYQMVMSTPLDTDSLFSLYLNP